MVPQGLSFIAASHEMAEILGAAAAVVVLSAAKKELYVEVIVTSSFST